MKLNFRIKEHPLCVSDKGFTFRSVMARDYKFWKAAARQSKLEFCGKMVDGSAFVIVKDGIYAGFFYHTVLWGSLPLLNMVFVRKSLRGNGAGRNALIRWEQLMKARGYKAVLVCLPSDMQFQKFYRRRGYADCGTINIDFNNKHTPSDLLLVKYL